MFYIQTRRIIFFFTFFVMTSAVNAQYNRFGKTSLCFQMFNAMSDSIGNYKTPARVHHQINKWTEFLNPQMSVISPSGKIEYKYTNSRYTGPYGHTLTVIPNSVTKVNALAQHLMLNFNIKLKFAHNSKNERLKKGHWVVFENALLFDVKDGVIDNDLLIKALLDVTNSHTYDYKGHETLFDANITYNRNFIRLTDLMTASYRVAELGRTNSFKTKRKKVSALKQLVKKLKMLQFAIEKSKSDLEENKFIYTETTSDTKSFVIRAPKSKSSMRFNFQPFKFENHLLYQAKGTKVEADNATAKVISKRIRILEQWAQESIILLESFLDTLDNSEVIESAEFNQLAKINDEAETLYDSVITGRTTI